MDIKTATVDRLCSLMREGADPILLLGAGASVKSGIPLSGEMCEKIAKFGYCLENAFSPEDPRIRRSDWYPWLRKQKWYREDLSSADNYPHAVDNILVPQEARKKFFQNILRTQLRPSSGYERITELMARRFIHTVLTTNFDTILSDVCQANSRIHHVSVIQTPAV